MLTVSEAVTELRWLVRKSVELTADLIIPPRPGLGTKNNVMFAREAMASSAIAVPDIPSDLKALLADEK